MKTHFTPEYFKNPTHPISITVIGCGGTGSHLLTKLARLNFTLLELNHPGIDLTCYDDDSVEFHNVCRQNFQSSDLQFENKNKAFTLISKINKTYGFEWKAFSKKYTAEKLKNNNQANIIITCVDTIDVRMKLAKYCNNKFSDAEINRIDYNTPFYWIDCGNGKDFGQVVLGTILKIKQPVLDGVDTVEELKNVSLIYGDLTTLDNEQTQGINSCSVLDSILKQDVFINDEIALDCAKIVKNILTKPFITSQGFVVNQENGITQPLPIR